MINSFSTKVLKQFNRDMEIFFNYCSGLTDVHIGKKQALTFIIQHTQKLT